MKLRTLAKKAFSNDSGTPPSGEDWLSAAHSKGHACKICQGLFHEGMSGKTKVHFEIRLVIQNGMIGLRSLYGKSVTLV